MAEQLRNYLPSERKYVSELSSDYECVCDLAEQTIGHDIAYLIGDTGTSAYGLECVSVVPERIGSLELNINELANALKPVVLPGEALKVFILKEGKEKDLGGTISL